MHQLTFGLWELANHRDYQEQLRAEINETLMGVKARGDVDFTANDFESMPYLVAFTKVRWDCSLASLIYGRIHSFLVVGNFEVPSRRRGNIARVYGRRCPTTHETDCWYLWKVVHKTTHSKGYYHRYLGAWI